MRVTVKRFIITNVTFPPPFSSFSGLQVDTETEPEPFGVETETVPKALSDRHVITVTVEPTRGPRMIVSGQVLWPLGSRHHSRRR